MLIFWLWYSKHHDPVLRTHYISCCSHKSPMSGLNQPTSSCLMGADAHIAVENVRPRKFRVLISLLFVLVSQLAFCDNHHTESYLHCKELGLEKQYFCRRLVNSVIH